jgi:hypothetical protein
MNTGPKLQRVRASFLAPQSHAKIDISQECENQLTHHRKTGAPTGAGSPMRSLSAGRLLVELLNKLIVDARNKDESRSMTSDASGDFPLEETGLTKTEPVSAANASGWLRLFLIPLFMVTLFTGAVIGMYFQPPGLRVFFNATGLEPGAGTDTPIAIQ